MMEHTMTLNWQRVFISRSRLWLSLVITFIFLFLTPLFLLNLNKENIVAIGIVLGVGIIFILFFFNYILKVRGIFKNGYEAKGTISDMYLSRGWPVLEYEFFDDTKKHKDYDYITYGIGFYTGFDYSIKLYKRTLFGYGKIKKLRKGDIVHLLVDPKTKKTFLLDICD